MKTNKLKKKLLKKHSMLGGIIIHMMGENYCIYSIVNENLDHDLGSNIRKITFDDLKKET